MFSLLEDSSELGFPGRDALLITGFDAAFTFGSTAVDPVLGLTFGFIAEDEVILTSAFASANLNFLLKGLIKYSFWERKLLGCICSNSICH